MNTYLRQPVLVWESGTAVALHEAGCSVAIGVNGSADADVARALLHDDGEDETLINPDNRGALSHGVPNSVHVISRIPCLEHLRFIGVEDLLQ